MATDIFAARMMILNTAWELDQGRDPRDKLSMVKVYASEMMNRVADQGIQIFGGMGWCKELPLERVYRDSRVLRIYDGTSEIHRMLIAPQPAQERVRPRRRPRMTDHADPPPFAFPPYERTRPRAGARAEFRKTMTVAEQAMFTGISGNMHPLYVNEVHASSTGAGSRLAFELAVASLATTALAELSGAFFRLDGIELSFPAMVRNRRHGGCGRGGRDGGRGGRPGALSGHVHGRRRAGRRGRPRGSRRDRLRRPGTMHEVKPLEAHQRR